MSSSALSPERLRASLRHARLFVCCAALTAGCRDTTPRARNSTSSAAPCASQARAVVTRLGERMRRVSLLAPDSIVARELASAYDSLVTPELLRSWQAAPGRAPGSQVSNPWPARIEIRSVEPETGGCRVDGEVVYVTSADTMTTIERHPVTVHVRPSDGRVSAFETASSTSADSEAQPPLASAPADVVRRYYAAIRAGDYGTAYGLWEQNGKASGQTRASFAAGFARTTQLRATVGDSVRIEGAAGSRYATVPVIVDAVLQGGQQQHFEGTYTLRRSVVDGASAEQREWHIYSARLHAR